MLIKHLKRLREEAYRREAEEQAFHRQWPHASFNDTDYSTWAAVMSCLTCGSKHVSVMLVDGSVWCSLCNSKWDCGICERFGGRRFVYRKDLKDQCYEALSAPRPKLDLPPLWEPGSTAFWLFPNRWLEIVDAHSQCMNFEEDFL